MMPQNAVPDDGPDEFFEDDPTPAPMERKMSYNDYYSGTHDNDDDNGYSAYNQQYPDAQYDGSMQMPPAQQQAPQSYNAALQYPQAPTGQQYNNNYVYSDEDDLSNNDGIVYTDDINQVIDKNGIFLDGFDVPHLRTYPKGLPTGGPRVKRLQPNGKYKIIQGAAWERFSKLMGKTKEALEKLEKEINQKPYDESGHLRIFLISNVSGRPYELGSMSEAQRLAESLRAKNDMLWDSSVNIHYREGDSSMYKDKKWPDKKKK